MRLGHFEALRPICAACLAERREQHPVVLSVVARRQDDDVLEGALQCSAPACRREYPIVDGIPLLVPDVRAYLATQLQHLTTRDDLSDLIEGFLTEGSGPGSPLDVARTHLSSYSWDHYGELDPDLPLDAADAEPRPGSVVRALEAGLAVMSAASADLREGPVLDLGCAVGRASFELAQSVPALVIGADLGFHLLRIASRVLRRGSIRYPLRRGGVRYDWREYPTPMPTADRVDFWACDAVHLPFATGTFAAAVGLNLIDCVYSPLDLLRSLARVLRPGGTLLLGSPYDWTPAATPIEAWVGGHSPRSLGGGRSDAVLRALLTPGAHPASVEGLELLAEQDEVPWSVRMHDRSHVVYRLHLAVARRLPASD